MSHRHPVVFQSIHNMELDTAWREIIRSNVPGAYTDRSNGGLVTFVARDFANWLVVCGFLRSRADAELMGEMLRVRDVIRPSGGESRFSSATVPWVCRGGEVPTSNNAFSVASLIGRSKRYVLGASFLKQGTLFLNPRFFTLDRYVGVVFVLAALITVLVPPFFPQSGMRALRLHD